MREYKSPLHENTLWLIRRLIRGVWETAEDRVVRRDLHSPWAGPGEKCEIETRRFPGRLCRNVVVNWRYEPWARWTVELDIIDAYAIGGSERRGAASSPALVCISEVGIVFDIAVSTTLYGTLYDPTVNNYKQRQARNNRPLFLFCCCCCSRLGVCCVENEEVELYWFSRYDLFYYTH